MADNNEFKTRHNYFSYKYARTHKKRARALVGAVSVVFALGLVTNGTRTAIDAINYAEDADGLTYQIQLMESKINKEEDEDILKIYNEQLELLNDQQADYKKQKVTSALLSSFNFIVAMFCLSIGKYMRDFVAKETDQRKKKFYKDFLDEIVFINDESSYRALDYIMFRVLEDAAAMNNKTVDELLTEIHKDEVFPEFDLCYDDILAYIDNFIKTTDYKNINPTVYNLLPLDYIQFAAFLKKKGVNIASFRYVPQDKAVVLMEEFLAGFFEKKQNVETENSIDEVQPVK